MRAEQVELSVSVRTEVGKTASRRLRASGKIPGVVYGRGHEAIPVAVEEALFASAVPETHWFSRLINLRIEGAKKRDAQPTVMIKEVQRDLVGRRLLSVDFRRVSLAEAVQTQVRVVVVGESPGIKRGGILEHLTHEVTVECLPTEVPDHLEVDVSAADIGDSLRVRDVRLPEGVKMASPEDEVLVVVAPPARVEEVAPTPAEEERAVVEEVEEPEVIGEAETEGE